MKSKPGIPDPFSPEAIRRAEKSMEDRPREKYLTILADDCHVTQIVYGNNKHPSWIPKKDETFSFNWVVASNSSFVVVQSGLNNYIFEVSKVLVSE